MINIPTKILVLTIALLVMVSIGTVVLWSEYNKKVDRYISQKDSQLATVTNWSNTQEELLKQIESSKLESKAQMEQTKKEYEALLAKQNALIAQHTKTVTTNQTSTNTSNNSNSNSQTTPVTQPQKTQVVKQTVSVPKPSSTPKTKSS